MCKFTYVKKFRVLCLEKNKWAAAVNDLGAGSGSY